MTILAFVVTFVFTAIVVYNTTERAFLTSKNEMIERDVRNASKELVSRAMSDWYLNYARNHSGDLTRPLSEEEQSRVDTSDNAEALFDVILNESLPQSYGEDTQLYIARNLFLTFGNRLIEAANQGNYLRVALASYDSDDTGYLYFGAKKDEAIMYDTPDTAGKDHSRLFTYSLDDHDAIEEMRKADMPIGKIFYEIYETPGENTIQYIAYSRVAKEGEKGCVISFQYDMTPFHNEMLVGLWSSVGIGFAVLVTINIILMAFLNWRVISPLGKVNSGVLAYMRNKDSGQVAQRMNEVRVRNELGNLADSFAKMADEMHHYNEENVRLEVERERISTELSLATNLQASMMPSAFPNREEFELYASVFPAKEVGGDFYDFFFIDDDHLALVIADVSGKGVPAALFMMYSKILVDILASKGGSPAAALAEINAHACANNSAQMFVTLWLGVLEISTGKLVCSNAGHEFPILFKEGKYELLRDKHGVAIGAIDVAKYSDYEIFLKPGEGIFVYTDGVAEASNKDKQFFGTQGALDALNAHPEASPQEAIANVKQAIDGFVAGEAQFDDITMLSLKYLGASNKAKTLTLEASTEHLEDALSFIDKALEEAGWPDIMRENVKLAAEEIFVNVASYAYAPDKGDVTLCLEMISPTIMSLSFIDEGVAFDPLAKTEPDISLPASQRQIGGLGIFMVRRLMDEVTYQRIEGKNILTLKKKTILLD